MAFTYTGQGVETDRGYKLPPEGDYPVQITAAEEKISQKGQAMIVLTVKIQHQEYHNEMREYIVDGPYAQQKIFDILSACGTPPAAGQAVGTQNFLGKFAAVRIKHEIHDGETYPRVRYWKSNNKVATAPAPTAQAPQNTAPVDEIPF
jgi:hypothetical protein